MEGGSSGAKMMSDEKPLYLQIVDWVRQEISEYKLSPGQRLPSIRQMTIYWNCTPGTIQRAYAELAGQGLVTSRPGQGTYITQGGRSQSQGSLRRALLVHRADAFLLETLTAGYQPFEIENAVRLALDHWRILEQSPEPIEEGILRFAGSHDPALTWLAGHFPEIFPHYRLQLGFNGSLGGLIALAEGKADFAGSHLWDKETDTYNSPFVRRLLPGRRVALLTFAHRRLGLILPSGNPANVRGLKDLMRPELVFINRQPGSGTRVWLDAALKREGYEPNEINGYANEMVTHTEVAAEIAEGSADVGVGLQSAALSFGLDYIHLVDERYDLVIPAENLKITSLQRLADWLSSPEAHQAINNIGGYDVLETGRITWVE